MPAALRLCDASHGLLFVVLLIADQGTKVTVEKPPSSCPRAVYRKELHPLAGLELIRERCVDAR